MTELAMIRGSMKFRGNRRKKQFKVRKDAIFRTIRILAQQEILRLVNRLSLLYMTMGQCNEGSLRYPLLHRSGQSYIHTWLKLHVYSIGALSIAAHLLDRVLALSLAKKRGAKQHVVVRRLAQCAMLHIFLAVKSHVLKLLMGNGIQLQLKNSIKTTLIRKTHYGYDILKTRKVLVYYSGFSGTEC